MSYPNPNLNSSYHGFVVVHVGLCHGVLKVDQLILELASLVLQLSLLLPERLSTSLQVNATLLHSSLQLAAKKSQHGVWDIRGGDKVVELVKCSAELSATSFVHAVSTTAMLQLYGLCHSIYKGQVMSQLDQQQHGSL